MASLMRSLVERRVPHSVALYIGVSWGCVQFTHFIVNEFLLSPHWTRVVLAAVLLFLPSVLMLAWFHGRPGRNRFPLVERVGIPANVVVVAVVLTLAYSGTDLGAAVTRVTVENEDGETIERAIPKAEFRKRTALFPFDAGPGLGDDDAWVSYLTPRALTLDLLPDDFFEPISDSLHERIKESGFRDLRNVPLALKRQLAGGGYAEFFVAGAVDYLDDQYRATMTVNRVDTGAMVADRRYAGPDILVLVDEMSVDLKAALEIPPREGVDDLPVRERLSADASAVESYGRFREADVVRSDWSAGIDHLNMATRNDPTFALAQLDLALLLLNNNRPQEAAAAIRAALDHVYRLPERLGFIVKANYYSFSGDMPRAMALLEMWADLYPEDPFALRNLVTALTNRGDWEGVLETLRRIYALNPRNAGLLKRMATNLRRLGDTDEALGTLQEYVDLVPDDHEGLTELAELYRARGDHDTAREKLDQALLLEPGRSELARRLASIHLATGRFADARGGFEEALALARTPRERAAAHAGLQDYHEFRGEMAQAIAAMESLVAEASTFRSTVEMALARVEDVNTYIAAGRTDAARTLFDDLRSRIPMPYAGIVVPHMELHIELAQANFDAAREAHARWTQAVEENAFQVFRADLIWHRGLINQAAGDHASALTDYRSARERDRDPASYYHDSERVGAVLRELGRLDEAQSELEAVLRLSPANPRAHLEMAHVLAAKGNVPAATEHLRAALRAWENADEVFEPAREARTKLAELGG